MTASTSTARLQFFATQTIDLAAREALYSGQLVVLKQVTATKELVHYFADSFLDPSSAASDLHIQERIQYCEHFESSPDIHRLYRDIFKEAGLIHKETHWDRLRLRVQQSGDPIDKYTATTFGTGRFSSTLPIHRDTWASNLPQQLNWWMPLTSLHEDCTLIMYPSYFNVPVSNNSGSWSVQQLKQANKNAQEYPQLPTMRLVDGGIKIGGESASSSASSSVVISRAELEKDAVPILIDPGDVLVFSGAHLHGSSVGGRKGSATRFSTEVRTYNCVDFDNKIGAINVDGNTTNLPNRKWFKELVL